LVNPGHAGLSRKHVTTYPNLVHYAFFLTHLRELGCHRHIAHSNILHKLGVGIKQHDVEVLNSMHALQTPPILEPHKILRFHFGAKRFLHKRVDFLMRFRCRKPCFGVVVELEFSPDDEVFDPGVDAVWPVVVQNLDVFW
jgi:hypothetical protein